MSPAEGEEEELGLIVKAISWERLSFSLSLLLLWPKNPLDKMKKKKMKILATKTRGRGLLVGMEQYCTGEIELLAPEKVASVLSSFSFWR